MPSNLILTQPNVVMPIGLMVAFSEHHERPALDDGIQPDGANHRTALTIDARRIFRLTRKLNYSEMNDLDVFLKWRKHEPFWFYNLRETAPPGSWDPTGASPVGRYAVVWNGLLEASTEIGSRGLITTELREVAY